MSAIEPNVAQTATLMSAAAGNSDPVVMINLLKFNENDGAADYQRYVEAVQPHLDAVDAAVLYAGDASHVVAGSVDKAWWDAIVIVRYPSRAAFVTMVTSQDYQEQAHIHRAAALESTHLIATDPWPVGR
ncbi:DUF1330 domain-containing protein [Nocardia lijiangensis]|uniref:DUF1330 domain-containing protein n=1 Tax=Nocardia lijiangensis TaxID=299618 RepID=UPI000829C731|nr:DUF1330 domain-containing protein [Nocardia lijiangensis]